MKHNSRLLLTGLAGVTMQSAHVARGQDFYLSLNGLVAYDDFEQTGPPGIANKAPGLSSALGCKWFLKRNKKS